MNELESRELELEYERLRGMECDDAAVLESDEQFIETIRAAYENIQKRKQKTEEIARVMEIYA